MNASANYAKGLGRAFVGAALFALPLFMTMEMWQLAFTVDRFRLCVFLVVALPLLVGLSHFAGFERTFGLIDDLLDAFAAFAVAGVAGAAIMVLFGAIAPGQPLDEIAAKVALVSVPGAIGALLADKQLGGDAPRGEADRSYGARLFLMTIGALFVALNVAPTEEMILIAFQITPWQAATLAIASLALLHALLFWIDFPGRETRRGEHPGWSILLRYSLAGYALCLLTSLFLLWTFGRTDGVGLAELSEFAVVLAFPAALGAALAHLVVGEQRA
jgi:putative integral membrane protein (TIGR02587 family)